MSYSAIKILGGFIVLAVAGLPACHGASGTASGNTPTAGRTTHDGATVSTPAKDAHLSADDWRRAVLALRAMNLRLPLDNFDPERIKGSFYEKRGNARHEAADMLAPRYTLVHAVCDGPVAKLFLSRFGGNTVYQFDSNKQYVFYYAHLQSYAAGLKEGQILRKGDSIGYVGTSGNAPPNTPHLHFSISVLGPEKQWWRAAPLDPYEVFTQHRLTSQL